MNAVSEITTSVAVHFGIDECSRMRVLAQRGRVDVLECGTSVAKLEAVLLRRHIDAVVITEDGPAITRETVATLRTLQPAPVVLFEGRDKKHDPSWFDLVIWRQTPPGVWLDAVFELIEHSRGIRQHSQFARQESVAMRQRSAVVRQEAVALREKARRLLRNRG